MANNQSIDTLNRLRNIFCSPGILMASTELLLFKRILKTCSFVANPLSFPSVQDQAIIMFLLDMASMKPHVKVLVGNTLEIFRQRVCNLISKADAEDHIFIQSFFEKLVINNLSMNEIVSFMTAEYFKSKDPLSNSLYWHLAKLISVNFDYYMVPNENNNIILELAIDILRQSSSDVVSMNMSMLISVSKTCVNILQNNSFWFNLEKKRVVMSENIAAFVHSIIEQRMISSSDAVDGDESLKLASISSSSLSSLSIWTTLTSLLSLYASCLRCAHHLHQSFSRCAMQLIKSLCSHLSQPLGMEGGQSSRNVNLLVATLSAVNSLSNMVNLSPNNEVDRSGDIVRLVPDGIKLSSTHSSVCSLLLEVTLSTFISGRYHFNDKNAALSHNSALQLASEGVLDQARSIRDQRHSDEILAQMFYLQSFSSRYPTYYYPTSIPSIGALDLLEVTSIYLLKEYQVLGWNDCCVKGFVCDAMDVIAKNISVGVVAAHGPSPINVCVRMLDLIQCMFKFFCLEETKNLHLNVTNDNVLLSLNVARTIYPNLVDILSCSMTSNISIVIATCKILSDIAAVFSSEFLELSTDLLCCSFSRSFTWAFSSQSHVSKASAKAIGVNIKLDEQDKIFTHFKRQKDALIFPTSPLEGNSVENLQSLHVMFAIVAGLQYLVDANYGNNKYSVKTSKQNFSSDEKVQRDFGIVLGLHRSLVDLFVGLANDAIGSALEKCHSIKQLSMHQALRSDFNLAALGCLLSPIALSMELLFTGNPSVDHFFPNEIDSVQRKADDVESVASVTSDNMFQYDISSLRSFWTVLSLLQLHNKDLWSNAINAYDQSNALMEERFQDFTTAIETIAKFTPPLVEFRGGSAIKYLEKELTMNSTAKLVKQISEKSSEKYDCAAWISHLTALNVSDIFQICSKRKSIGVSLYICGVACLESVRIRAHHDVRALFFYFCDEGVFSSPVISKRLFELADKTLYDVWENSLVLHSNSNTIMSASHIEQKCYISRKKLSDTFNFIVTRCVHNNAYVRKLALSYCYKIATFCPSLQWEKESVFTLMNCFQILAVLRFVVDGRSKGEHGNNLPLFVLQEPWIVRSYFNTLPPIEMPGNASEISVVGFDVLSLGYTWLSDAVIKVPHVQRSILQEYILHQGCNGASPLQLHVSTDLGVSIANEMISSSIPYYHLRVSSAARVGTEEIVLSQERSEAAKFVESKYTVTRKSSAPLDFISFSGIESREDSNGSSTASIAFKACYIGEANIYLNGLLSLNNQSSEKANVDINGVLLSYYKRFNEVIFPQEHGLQFLGTSSVIAVIMRGAAITRTLCFDFINLEKSALNHHFTTILNKLSSVNFKYFSSEVTSCMLYIWRWMSSFAGSLLPLVLNASINAFKTTAILRYGLFSSAHNNSVSHSTRGNAASGKPKCSDARVENVEILSSIGDSPFKSAQAHGSTQLNLECLDSQPHEAWLAYLHETLVAYDSHIEVVFSVLESLLFKPSHMNTSSIYLISYFQLLNLGFRAIQIAVNLTERGLSGPSVLRRRILRERIIFCACQWFSKNISTPDAVIQRMEDEYAVMFKFLQLLTCDYKLWVSEYKDKFLNGAFFAEEHRLSTSGVGVTAGHHFREDLEGVQSFGRMRHSAGYVHLLMSRRDEEIASRGEGGLESTDGSDAAFDSKSKLQTQGNLYWLIKAFIIHHLDHLIAWKGTQIYESSDIALLLNLESNNFPSMNESEKYVMTEMKKIKQSSFEVFRAAVENAWCVMPTFAISFVERFRRLDTIDTPSLNLSSSSHVTDSMISLLLKLIAHDPYPLRSDYRAVPYLFQISSMAKNNKVVGNTESQIDYNAGILKVLVYWVEAPVLLVVDMLNRNSLSVINSSCAAKNNYNLNGFVLQYATRSLAHQSMGTLQFYIPQFIQLLRRDRSRVIRDILQKWAGESNRICHQLIWQLEGESVEDLSHIHKNKKLANAPPMHGHCRCLQGRDTLPDVASSLLLRLKNSLSTSALDYLNLECEFFNKITNISAKLTKVKDKDLHQNIIRDAVLDLGLPKNLYLPTDPFKLVIKIDENSGRPMQSAAKCPFLLVFHTKPWGGPDSLKLKKPSSRRNMGTPRSPVRSDTKHPFSSAPMSLERKYSEEKADENMLSPHIGRHRFMSMMDESGHKYDINEDSIDMLDDEDFHTDDGDALSVSSLALREIDSPKKDHKRHHSVINKIKSSLNFLFSDHGDITFMPNNHLISDVEQKFRKGWNRWKGIQRSTKKAIRTLPSALLPFPAPTSYPSHLVASQDDELQACIFKVYDDCRQDSMIIQVMTILKDTFECIGLSLHLVPYNIVPNRTGADMAPGGILQVVPNVKSRDQMGKYGAKTLMQYYVNQFGNVTSPEFKRAQRKFAESLAGYAIVCYLLSIKDRHNGNILVDSEGHIIHIDFGFLLGISPGGNLGFESAAFKLSAEMIELLGGNLDAEPFRLFVDLTVRGFLAARLVMNPILIVVASMADSGLPCFLHRIDNLVQLRDRFVPTMTSLEAAEYMKGLISDAANKWTTICYDGIQKLQNNIYSDKWK